MTPEFKQYQAQVRLNARKLASELVARGHTLVTGGTDNHLVLWDVRPHSLTGNKLEKLFEMANISVNKNAVYGDTSALAPGGIRVGTPALTSRGFTEVEMVQVAEFLDRGVKISVEIQSRAGKLLKDFVAEMEKSEAVKALRAEVVEFSKKFPMPGL
jgi:glycine hydroxymethyltransferase